MKRVDTMVHRSRALLGMLAIAGLIVPQGTGAMSIDVSPVRIEIKARPGESPVHSISVQNTGSEPVRLRAYVEDWSMTEDGTPMFVPAGTGHRSATGWLDWAPRDFLLEPEEIESVRFTIHVPDGTVPGGYRGSLILESLPLDRSKQTRKQVQIRGRVACMVYLSIGDSRREAKITSMRTIAREDRVYLQVKVHNTGEDNIRLGGDLTLLAGDVELGDPITIPDVPVLPGDRRLLEFELPPEHLTEALTAEVTVVVPGAGHLVGECSVTPQQADLLSAP